MLDIGECKVEKNKKSLRCPVTRCLEVIGGKWKMVIVSNIYSGINRFGILQKQLPGISKQMLTSHLRELEADGIISRTIYPVIPPRVDYAITPLGETLFPIANAMREWGERHTSE